LQSNLKNRSGLKDLQRIEDSEQHPWCTNLYQISTHT